MTTLFTLHDGTTMRTMNVKELIRIPIWKGNRIIDSEHCAKLKKAIGQHVKKLDFGYRIAVFNEEDASGKLIPQKAIIDGQHRVKVLQDWFTENMFMEDFQVVVMERYFSSEGEVAEYFEQINNAKPIQFMEPEMIVNQYIRILESTFNKNPKELMIRPKTTRRPYLSAETLREVLMKYPSKLTLNKTKQEEFITKVKEWNQAQVEIYSNDLTELYSSNVSELHKKGAKVGFMLAIDAKLRWVGECL
jgi:hypothetical protein